MKVSFSLTLDGMIRALRTKLHHVQDQMEFGAVEAPDDDGRPGTMRRRLDNESGRERDGSGRG